ncbi:MAG: PaaI family thioesterase [Bacteroidia bacterium]
MNYYEFFKDRLKNNHFINHMGLVLEMVESGEAHMTLEVGSHHLQQNGFLHGGVTATICDVVTGIAAYTAVDESKNVVTADLKVSYLNPSTSNFIRAKGRIKKAGKFLIYCDGEVFDVFEDGTEKLIASCTSIMAAVDIPVVQNPQK